MELAQYLSMMVEHKASDLYLTANAPIKVKIDGRMNSVGDEPLTPVLTRDLLYGIMDKTQVRRYEGSQECDFSVAMQGSEERFRVNVFSQRGSLAAVIRYIPSRIPSIDELGLPVVLKDLVLAKRGLLFVVGATGSGKSTTLASMLDHRNKNRAGHILTIEDPIEFSHANVRSVINQREIGVDTNSYSSALRASMRQNPDVVMIGEIRDRETLDAALQLCNTGHLVLATMHASNAQQTMERLINMVRSDEQKLVLMDVGLSLNAVVSQRLLRGVKGKLCPAVELLVRTPHIQELLLNGRFSELKEAMASSGARGMCTFDQSMYDMYKAGVVGIQEALENADSRADLEARVHF